MTDRRLAEADRRVLHGVCHSTRLAKHGGLPVCIALWVIVAIKESNVAHSGYLLLLQAVCCSDKEHCCPEGYTCDVAGGTCNKGLHSMSWNAVAVRDVDRVFSSDVVCPGGQQECDDGQTCCELDSGSYGCCPYDKVLHVFLLC